MSATRSVAVLFLGGGVALGVGCGRKPDDVPLSASTASAAISSSAAITSSAPAVTAARKSLGLETNARMELTTRCPDCPSYVVTVDRSGAIAFTGERRVRMSRANGQLADDQRKALFEHVVPDVFADRGTDPAPTKKLVTLRFEDGAGSSTLPGDSPCAAPTGRYDRHNSPSARCELENALRDAARPFLYCGPQGCPEKPDPNAQPADFGDVTVGCKPACTRILLDGKPLGKTPATRRLTPGLHELELVRGGRWGRKQTQKTSVRVEAGQHSNVIVDMSRPTMEVELERAMGEVAARMLGQR